MKFFISSDKKYHFLVYPWIFAGKGYRLDRKKLLLFLALIVFVVLPTNIFFIFKMVLYGWFHRFYLDENIPNVLINLQPTLDAILSSELTIYFLAYLPPRPFVYFIAYIQFCLQTICLLKLLKTQKDREPVNLIDELPETSLQV